MLFKYRINKETYIQSITKESNVVINTAESMDNELNKQGNVILI